MLNVQDVVVSLEVQDTCATLNTLTLGASPSYQNPD